MLQRLAYFALLAAQPAEYPIDKTCYRQGWVQWSLSGMSSMLGHMPSKEPPPASPARPTQEQMAELYDAFDINQQDLQDGKDTNSKLEFVADIRVRLLLGAGLILRSVCDNCLS